MHLVGISKRFGRVQAVGGVDFTLQAGEVHGLLGENGAGKSTLMHVAYGLERADQGTITVHGRLAEFRTPRDARRAGIGMVHQHFTSVPAFTVEENVKLFGGDPVRLARMGRDVDHLLEGLSWERRVSSLGIAHRQRLEILKAIAGGERILLLDEPTAVLTPVEVDELLHWVRRFADGGGAVVLITHKLREALAVTDRVTVLRHGHVTLTGATPRQTAESLALAMLGTPSRDLAPAPLPPSPASPTAVSLRGVSIASLEHPDRLAIRAADLEVAAGEILGIAAIAGSGQRELLLCLAGLHRSLEGSIRVLDPIAFVPADRTREGIIPEFSLTENLVLGICADHHAQRSRWIDWKAAAVRTRTLLAEFDVRAAGPEFPASTLSGGNQQKLIIARALERRPRVLVAEAPTRGLDFQAAAAVHDRLRTAATDGVAVIVHSPDLDELHALATRMVVVEGGRCRGVPTGAGREEIGRLMLGASAVEAP